MSVANEVKGSYIQKGTYVSATGFMPLLGALMPGATIW